MYVDYLHLKLFNNCFVCVLLTVATPGRVMVLNDGSGGGGAAGNGAGEGGGLITPRRLVNPCLESSPRQDLHRELLFNQKM